MSVKTVKFIYNLLLCISILLAGALLIAGCLNIYFTGPQREQVYTAELVAAEFSKIAVPVYICIILVIGSFVLDLIFPGEKPKAAPDTDFMLEILKKKKDDTSPDIANERKFRKTNTIILAVLTFITSVIFFIYALDPSHFHQSEINSSMINAMKWLFPCLAIPFIFAVFAAYQNERSKKREISLLKEADKKEEQYKPEKQNAVNIVRTVIIAVAVIIFVYGFASGGTADVLTKAINICTECIGLG